MAFRREIFDSVRGFDESFPVAFNDLDFCLRVGGLGNHVLYRGDAVLIHHESQSRGLDDMSTERRRRLAGEIALFTSRWGTITDDPYGSPAFDPSTEAGLAYPWLAQAWGRQQTRL